MAAISSSPPIPILILLSLAAAASAAVETFTYVNSGEFGPYITEDGSDYRVLAPFGPPFYLCFRNSTPNAFHLALRMGTRRSESTFRWVWQANLRRPVSDNATLSLLPDGNLVLADADGRVAWSTSTAGRGVVGLKVLRNGNMVLHDRAGRFVWQSFDHPTDTILVGQSIRRGTALVNGDYRLALGNGLAMYVNASSTPLLYGSLGGSGGGGEAEVKLVCEPGVAYEVRLEWSSGGTSVLARPKYNATLSLLRLEADGNLVVWTYYDPVDYEAWEMTFAFFSEGRGFVSGCWLPSKCGAFGVCEDEMCVGCPTARGVVGWSGGCRPPAVEGGCDGGAERRVGYYEVVGVENFLASTEVGLGVGVEECRRRCSGDCRCLGFLYRRMESRCWLAPLLGTLRKVSNSSHVAYIKYSK